MSRPQLPQDDETPADLRDRFLDLIDGGASSDLADRLLAIRVGGLTEEGLEAGLRLGNAIWLAVHRAEGE